mmetsp:Transcript_43143/g.97269  ORF Transcript_43143/g.97269 Transcript_43143/m.97269 type:complete len:505 (-) Transcript_43143:251-1765(-)
MGAGCGKKELPSRQKATRKKSFYEEFITRSMFILSNPAHIREVYDVRQQRLGEGTYGAVYRGVHRFTGVARAIKKISKANMQNIDLLYREMEIMKIMDHPNIIKLFETFEDAGKIYLVMELCEGGDLFDRILLAGRFAETDAALMMQDILRAIFYMHQNQICHRDLKPENFLFQNKGPIDQNSLKLIDFGFANRFGHGMAHLTTKVGTAYYIAPQVLKRRYNHLCDLWSAGAIMYTLLCGRPPFHGRTDQEVLCRVTRGVFDFPTKNWHHISADAKDLIVNLLRFNPRYRFDAEQALNHNWIRLLAPRAPDVSLGGQWVSRLAKFKQQNRLKKAAQTIIAGQLDEAAISDLRVAFMALDANGDGVLSLSELREGLRQRGLQLSDSELEHIMDSVDSDRSGSIGYTEFLAASLDRKFLAEDDICRIAFQVFDQNSDGLISQEDLTNVLDRGKPRAASDAIMKEADRNGDGNIDFHEFMALMGRSRPGSRHCTLNSGLSCSASAAA